MGGYIRQLTHSANYNRYGMKQLQYTLGIIKKSRVHWLSIEIENTSCAEQVRRIVGATKRGYVREKKLSRMFLLENVDKPDDSRILEGRIWEVIYQLRSIKSYHILCRTRK